VSDEHLYAPLALCFPSRMPSGATRHGRIRVCARHPGDLIIIPTRDSQRQVPPLASAVAGTPTQPTSRSSERAHPLRKQRAFPDHSLPPQNLIGTWEIDGRRSKSVCIPEVLPNTRRAAEANPQQGSNILTWHCRRRSSPLSEAPVKGGGAGDRAILIFFLFLYTQNSPIYPVKLLPISTPTRTYPPPRQIHQRIPGICGSSFLLPPVGTISRILLSSASSR
jgi:hypothetical protein